MAGRILDRITVLAAGRFIAGPATGTLMAHVGAATIKVEPPHTGDPSRELIRLPGLPRSEHNSRRLLDASPTGYGEVGQETNQPGFDDAALEQLRAAGTIE